MKKLSDGAIAIKTKSRLAQMFCKHEYHEGTVSRKDDLPFFNLSGDTYTTICVKCGKIKSTRFVPNWDGS